jgi:hypothetical protein
MFDQSWGSDEAVLGKEEGNGRRDIMHLIQAGSRSDNGEATMNITMDGKYQTRDGRAVRILAITNNPTWPVVGIITHADGIEGSEAWMKDGKYKSSLGECAADLIPVPTKHEGWGVVNRDGQLIAGYSGDLGWDKAGIKANIFSGDTVVHLSWED